MAQAKPSTKLPPLNRGPMVGGKKQPNNTGANGEVGGDHETGDKKWEPDRDVSGIDFYASYVSEAMKHMQLKQLDVALMRLESAARLKPKDANCRLLKARCLISQSKLKMALNVINQVLEDHPDNYTAAEMRGEVLYNIGQFEQAIVQYQRAKSMRPKRRALKDGIDNCEQAMRNAIGPKYNQPPGRDQEGFEMQEPDNSRDQEFFEDKEAGVVKDITERDPPTKGNEKVAKKKNNHGVLLGDFYRDYVFLQGLLERQIVTNKRTALGQEVAPVVEEALKYLDTRADFWQRQEPLYKRDQSGAYKVCDEKARKAKPGDVVCNTDSKLQYRNAILKINQMFEEKDYEGGYNLAQDTLQLVKGAPDDEINPVEKMIFLGELFSLCGMAQQNMGNNGAARNYFTQDKDLAYEKNNEDGKFRSLDNLTSNYIASQDYDSALQTLLERLRLTDKKYQEHPGDKGLEGDLAWLHHELARTYMQQDQLGKASDHAAKSVEFAELCDDDSWILQGNFVAGEVFFQMGELENARNSLLAAQDVIRSIDDQEGEFVAIDKKISAYLDEIDKVLIGGGSPGSEVYMSTDDVQVPQDDIDSPAASYTTDDRYAPSYIRTDMGPDVRSHDPTYMAHNRSAPSYVSSGGASSPISSAAGSSPWRGKRALKKKRPAGLSPGRGRGGGPRQLRPLRPKRPGKKPKSTGIKTHPSEERMAGSSHSEQMSKKSSKLPPLKGMEIQSENLSGMPGSTQAPPGSVTSQGAGKGQKSKTSQDVRESRRTREKEAEFDDFMEDQGAPEDFEAEEEVYEDDLGASVPGSVRAPPGSVTSQGVGRRQSSKTSQDIRKTRETLENQEEFEDAVEDREPKDFEEEYAENQQQEEVLEDDLGGEEEEIAQEELEDQQSVPEDEDLEKKSREDGEESEDAAQEREKIGVTVEEQEQEPEDDYAEAPEGSEDGEDEEGAGIEADDEGVTLSADAEGPTEDGSVSVVNSEDSDKERTPSAGYWRSSMTPDDIEGDEVEDEDGKGSIAEYIFDDDKDRKTRVEIDPNTDASTVISSSHEQKSNKKVRSVRGSQQDAVSKTIVASVAPLDIREDDEQRESEPATLPMAPKDQQSTPRESESTRKFEGSLKDSMVKDISEADQIPPEEEAGVDEDQVPPTQESEAEEELPPQDVAAEEEDQESPEQEPEAEEEIPPEEDVGMEKEIPPEADAGMENEISPKEEAEVGEEIPAEEDIGDEEGEIPPEEAEVGEEEIAAKEDVGMQDGEIPPEQEPAVEEEEMPAEEEPEVEEEEMPAEEDVGIEDGEIPPEQEPDVEEEEMPAEEEPDIEEEEIPAEENVGVEDEEIPPEEDVGAEEDEMPAEEKVEQDDEGGVIDQDDETLESQKLATDAGNQLNQSEMEDSNVGDLKAEQEGDEEEAIDQEADLSAHRSRSSGAAGVSITLTEEDNDWQTRSIVLSESTDKDEDSQKGRKKKGAKKH